MVTNSTLSKRPKSLFFNQFALKQIASLLDYSVHDCDEESSKDVQDKALEILLKLCSDKERGICYRAKDVPQGLEK